MHIYHRQEAIQLEEKERERRIRALKTKSEPVHFSGKSMYVERLFKEFPDQKEEVHRELLSKVDSAKTQLMEENERERRILLEKIQDIQVIEK
jgi:hypothetical protein